MRTLLLVAVLLLGLAAPSAADTPCTAGETVSLLRIIAAPESVEGRCIATIGVLDAEDSQISLYVSHEDFANAVLTNAIGLDPGQSPGSVTREGLRSLHGQYVIVSGRLVALTHQESRPVKLLLTDLVRVGPNPGRN